MRVDGQCHCGRVTYVADVDYNDVSLCHCTDCQVLCGSPWRASVPAAASSFRLTGAAPRMYVKTADSGARRAQAFCADCGTPIYATAPDNPTTFNLRIGAIRQRDQLRPSRQIWCRSALPWASDVRALPASERE